MSDSPYNEIESLRLMLTTRATGGYGDEQQYQQARRVILSDLRLKKIAPKFLNTCRTLDDFWSFIKQEYASYQERREFLRDQFDPLLTATDFAMIVPVDATTNAVIEQVDSEHVRDIWQKALERRLTDPEGAITTARTLLEAVCKHILDGLNKGYSDKDDLPKLYGRVAKELNIAPSLHTEEVFKRILGGCHSVVEGLGSLRNKMSDAHSPGAKHVKPAPRHAELAVNLSGAMATFLISTWEARKTDASVGGRGGGGWPGWRLCDPPEHAAL